jgi:hypothetical protein
MNGTAGLRRVGATVLVAPKGPADLAPEAKLLNRILQMDGAAVARELPAEHHLITDGWGRHVFLPSLVYMPEKDRLLLRCSTKDTPWVHVREPMHSLLLASDDHGRTWSGPIDRPMVRSELSAPGMVLSYLGQGKLLEVGEASGAGTRWYSDDYGHTWRDFPAPHRANGFAFYVWDQCLADHDPHTGELQRVAMSGYSEGMDRQFHDARTVAVLPDTWHWRHDPRNRGLDEGWQRESSFAAWPRQMRIDRHWTMQGEPGGVGWYATEFALPDTRGTPLTLLFGSVDGTCDVFIDGEKVGEQKLSPEIMWNRPFHLPLAAGLAPGRHTLVIRVEKEVRPDWNAGIYKPIWIVDAAGLDIRPDRASWPPTHALVRFSYDGGLTWPEEIEPPTWNGASGVGVNEVALARAANHDLIAACRLEHPKYYAPGGQTPIDHYCGLGISISKDNGTTWSPMNILYEYGRMHPSVALLPNGDLVMTYVERCGALHEEHRLSDADGYSRWGVEAVVSHDHGASWDLSHRYILARWSGQHHAQSTSTVLLPDGALLTAFGSGYLSQPVHAPIAITHEVCLVRWRPDSP